MGIFQKYSRCSLTHAVARVLMGPLFVISACISPDAIVEKIDNNTYAILQQRSNELFGTNSDFEIDPPEGSLRQKIINGQITQLDNLKLIDCLEISAENSREYQNKKEDLYRTVLDLTLEQWNFGYQFSLGGEAVISDGDTEVNPTFTISKLFGTGANIIGQVGGSLLQLATNGAGWSSLSNASFSITQPLLRGSAREIIREPLTQAERNLVYEVRSFERYRSTFALGVATGYFQLIQTIDNVKNEEANFEGLLLLSQRNQALAEAGQLSDIEADEAQQDTLESKNRLLELRGNLNQQLDNFKLSLGLPMDTVLEFIRSDMSEFEDLEDYLLDLDEERSCQIAFDKRLDFLNRIDATHDAERKVQVAKEALKAGLDLQTSGDRPSGNETTWATTISFDLPLNRIPEHNSYRSSLISMESAHRSEQEMRDTISAKLRDETRNLRNTRKSYEIQLNAVLLAQQRVESTELSLAAGRSDTRAALDARRALVSAQDSATSSMVARLLARLSLISELGCLRIDKNGFKVDLPNYLRQGSER